MSSRDIVVFDLDGTLSDDSHRRHFVEEGDWKGYYRACPDDLPLEHVHIVWHALKATGKYHHWILTGRSDLVKPQTLVWLQKYGLAPDRLVMRVNGDSRKDNVIKNIWIGQHIHRVAMAFEDRDHMVQWWRDQGIPCFQIQPGKY